LLAHPIVSVLLTHSPLKQVVMIDGREIGDGKIGPVTRQIQNAYMVLTAGQGVAIPRNADA
jgi:protein-lysine N-methyltransferase EEF2KMT